MKVIVFAATKGGVGKTTLAYNVALAAALKHQVLITDLDPQGSLRELWAKRNELVNPRMVSNVDSVAQAVRLLTSAGYGREFLFVDTPGSMMPVITDAIGAADLIVLPTQPSPLDLHAQEAVAARVEKMGLRDRTMFVLTRTVGSQKADTEKALEYLRLYTPFPIPTISERADYKRAAETGKAAWELSNNKDIKSEVRKLWQAMLAAMKKPTVTEKTDAQRLHH
jgi:chromosome partitioning protein